MAESADTALPPGKLPQPRKRRRPIVPDVERRRVKAACLPCRSNKLKCDNQRPCQRCQKTSTACHFADTTPGGAGGTLRPSEREQLLEAILKKYGISVPDDLDALRLYVEHMYSSRQTNRPNLIGPQHLGPSARSLSTTPQRSRPEEPTKEVQNEQEDSDGSSVVVGHVPKSQTHVHDQGKTFFNGGFSAWAFFDSVHETVARDQTSHQPGGEATTAYKHFMIESPEVLFNDLRTSLLAAIPPREVLDFLTSTFFRYSQSNFFWVHPEIFSRKQDAFLNGTHEFDPQNRSPGKRPAEFICSLFMVLALGSQYADLDQDRPPPDLPGPELSNDDRFDISGIKVPAIKRNPGWRFYQVSRRLLADVVCSCSMTSIQACALQGVFLITTSAHDIAYNMWGLAVRMCVNMGLHQAAGEGVLHPHVRELRNRLWWSVMTLDCLFGHWMGRPKMLDDNDCDTPFPEDLPELRLEQPTGSVRGQIALIKICRIIDRIVKRIYPSTASSPGKGQVINMESFIELQEALEQWKSDLPPKLKLSPTSTRGTVHLHLTQQHAVMLMTRTSLSHVAATVGFKPNSKHSMKTNFLLDAARQCISAAVSTIRLLAGLEERGLLCQYAFQDPLYCTAALCVLLLAAKLEPPGPEMKEIIIQGVLLLQQLSKGSETANSSLEGIVNGFKPYLKPRIRAPTEGTQPNGQTTRAQGRKAWEAWMSQPTRPGSPVMTNHTQAPNHTLVGEATLSISGLSYNYLADASTNTRDDRDSSRQPDTETISALHPDYQSMAFDDLMNTWTGAHPFWFSELEDGVGDLT
ncbi:unnamed protein product [Clonostachys solani]|uniref:Zn(2)-C6 fungal-type domain-containing protein n=1 Tax=Clonostachys solani TaxID=160281 RepID=A0A9N9ZIF5_9HYPO|nr:unnamed protein product [Clonostachys solani]